MTTLLATLSWTVRLYVPGARTMRGKDVAPSAWIRPGALLTTVVGGDGGGDGGSGGGGGVWHSTFAIPLKLTRMTSQTLQGVPPGFDSPRMLPTNCHSGESQVAHRFVEYLSFPTARCLGAAPAVHFMHSWSPDPQARGSLSLWTGAWPTQPAITQAVNRRGERGREYPSLYSTPVVSIGPLWRSGNAASL